MWKQISVWKQTRLAILKITNFVLKEVKEFRIILFLPVLSNLLLATFLLGMMKKVKLVSCLLLAVATYQNFYPVMLIFPLCAAFCLGRELSPKDVVVKVTWYLQYMIPLGVRRTVFRVTLSRAKYFFTLRAQILLYINYFVPKFYSKCLIPGPDKHQVAETFIENLVKCLWRIDIRHCF